MGEKRGRGRRSHPTVQGKREGQTSPHYPLPLPLVSRECRCSAMGSSRGQGGGGLSLRPLRAQSAHATPSSESEKSVKAPTLSIPSPPTTHYYYP